MKNRAVKDILVLAFMVIVIYIICLFLPDSIPIHFDFRGNADMYVNKFFLLFATVIPYSAYWKFFRK